MSGRLAIVVMGVAGSGKSSLGAALADRLGIGFVDGDALHGAANVAKMRAGIPLDDADRLPWLDRVGEVLADGQAHPRGVVVACSALKRVYRDRIRVGAGKCRFLYLDLTMEEAARRVGGRPGHFMPTSLVVDQFAVLERPTAHETDAVTLDAMLPLDRLVEEETALLASAA